MTALPILIQVYFNAALAYWLNRQLGVEWCIAGPSALIGASNFFELVVATAIALFGFQSRATHAKRLIETPHERWLSGFYLRGRGSTFDRARTIQAVYMENLPVPGPTLDYRSIELLRDLQTLVGDAIENAGGTLIGEALG
jgi:hypothetical protein